MMNFTDRDVKSRMSDLMSDCFSFKRKTRMNKPNEFSGPEALTGIVSYQDGSIVSRILFKTGNGSATVFAFDKGQELSEHTVPFEALVCIVDGEGEFTISGVTHTVKTGEVIRMPAGEPHAVKATERFKMLLSMVKDA